jgi:phosphatidylserine/phosphatidylglycerophosphate/cardiolipin synthase-like enzyme
MQPLRTSAALLLSFGLTACKTCPVDSAVPPEDSEPTPADSLTDSDAPPDSAPDSPWDTAPPEPEELLPEHFSHVAQAALEALEAFPGSQGVTWGYSADAVFLDDWILQTPEAFHWGQEGDSFALDVDCDDAGCDPEFGLRLCVDQGDCVDGGRCQEVAASVTSPGEAPLTMCVDHSAAWWDGLYSTIVQGTDYVDLASLAAADGRFAVALRNAVTYLHNAGSEARVRVIFGNIPGMGPDPDEVLDSLTRDINSETTLQLHVGIFHDDYTSWNHSKIVAVDGAVLLQGGHNLWHDHYLTTAPVHDVSLRLEGSPAGDAHRFLDRLWEYACEDIWVGGWTDRASFPSGTPSCPPPWAMDAETPYQSGARVIATGRLGALGEDPSDEALLAMIRAAEESVYFSLQDLGPIRLVGDWSLSDWPEEVLAALGVAIAHGVDVKVVLSNPESVPGGLSSYDSSYNNGWSLAEVAQALQAWFQENPGVASPDQNIHELICDNLSLAWMRFSDDERWSDDTGFANHAKLFIVDEQAFYIGSQNLYPADLQEFGLIVDDPAITAELLSSYWEPLWAYSSVTAQTGPEAEECDF